MALTRRLLKETLADRPDRDELIDQIIDAHIEVVAPLKGEINRLREEYGGKTGEEIAAEVAQKEAELAALKEGGAGEVDETGVTWKQRCEAITAEFEAAKADGEKWQTTREKAAALRSLLEANGVSRSLAEIIVRGSGPILDNIEVQGEKIRNHEAVFSELRGEFGQFIDPKN